MAGVIVACLGLVLSSSGCGSDRPTVKAVTDPLLALVLPNSTSDFWDALRDAAVAEGQDQAVDVLADATDTNDNGSAQGGRVIALAAEKYDCFVIAPVNTVQLVSPLLAVAKKNIPILNIGMQLDENAAKSAGLAIASYIAPQHKEVGYLAARRMLTAVPAESQVAMLVGSKTDPSERAQLDGFSEAIGDKLDLLSSEPTDDDYEKIEKTVTDLLAAKPGLRGIFATSDPAGLAAVKAVKAAGLASEVSVISVGGSQQAMRAVEAKELTATVATYPAFTGSVVIHACQRLVAGGALQPRLTIPSRLIDSSDVAVELKSYPEPAEQFQDPLS